MTPMKLAFALLALLVGVPPAAASIRDASAPADRVERLLDAWHDAASRADADAYFGALTPDAVFFGTDATERWSVAQFRAYAEPHFADGHGWTLLPVERHVFVGPAGRTAWFDEEIWTEHLGECRATGVCTLDDAGDWKIAQYNLSIPIPNAIADDVVAQAETETGRASALTLDVMTFNIRYDNPGDGANAWANRRGIVGELVRRERPDILGLQEALAHQEDQLLADLPLYRAIGVGRDDGVRAGELSPILYLAGRFEAAEQGTFWLSDTPGVPGSASWGNSIPRICTWARLVDRATGQGVYVFNCHLDHVSAPSRERAAGLIGERAAARAHPEDRVIITGDFNAALDSAPIRALHDAGYRSAHASLHKPDGRVGTFNGWRPGDSGPMIDHVLVGQGVEPLHAGVVRDRPGGRYASDHFPVTARLRVERLAREADPSPRPTGPGSAAP